MAEDLYDAPNQQVVRPDGSHPSDEGTGGSKEGDKPKRSSGKTKKDDTEEE